jgi:TRAP-type C4-dicarboxylate transport system permease small subunit
MYTGVPPRDGEIHTGLERVCNALGLVSLFAMMALITTHAILRYLINSPIPGTVTIVSIYLLPTAIFLTTPSLQRNGGNIGVEIVSKRFSALQSAIVDLIWQGIAVLIFAVVTWGAYKQMMTLYSNSVTQQLGGGTFVPVYVSWLVMVIGLALLCLRLLTQLFATSSDVINHD